MAYVYSIFNIQCQFTGVNNNNIIIDKSGARVNIICLYYKAFQTVQLRKGGFL